MTDWILDIIRSEMFLTVFSGIIVFVFSQYILELIIKPRTNFKIIKGEVLCILTMYANYIANPFITGEDNNYAIPDEYKNASNELRYMASKLAGHLESHRIICRKSKYYSVVSCLIKLSNSLWINIRSKRDIYTENEQTANEIYKIFSIKGKF